MAKSGPAVSERIASVCDLTVGDGIYSDGSKTPYWVVEMTRRNVVLENADGERYTWLRETLDASLTANTWIQQSCGAE